MLNTFAKLLLVATSLSPMLGAIAVNQYAKGGDWTDWVPWLAPAVLLFIICALILHFATSVAQVHPQQITKVERTDKEVLGFLLAYLLPVVSAKESAFQVHWQTVAYAFVILLLVFTHANALHFNPLLGLLGYHFYTIEDSDGRPILLISRQPFHLKGQTVQVVSLSPSICLHVPEKS